MIRHDNREIISPLLLDQKMILPNPARLALVYIGFAILWISSSDLLLGWFFPDFESFLLAQMVKGAVFVVVTGYLVFLLIRRAEQGALNLEHSFRTFTESTGDWEYWMGSDGKILYMTPSCKRVTGYEPSAFYRSPGLMQEIIHPDDLSRVTVAHGDGTCGGQGIEYRIVCLDGTVRWILHECHHVSDVKGLPAGIRGNNKNITKRIEAGEALRQSEKRFRTLFEEAAEGIFVADAESLALKYANPKGCRMLGCTESQIQQMHMKDIYSQRFGPLPMEAVKGHLRGDLSLISAVPLATCDGVHRYADITTAPMAFDGTPCLVGFFTDVTQRRELELKHAANEVHLRQAQKMESMGTLASGVAHEINNPIMGITGYADLIGLKADADPEVCKYAGEIIREAKRIHRIVTNLLCFARHEKSLNPRAVGLHEIVGATLSLVHMVVVRDQIHLEVEIPEALPKVLCLSPQIQQVVMNLLTNARDALNSRYPESHENKVIRIAAFPRHVDGAWVRLTVEDHGGGISAVVRDRMFDPFYTTKAEGEGTGLGLSITYGIVKEHGGKIEVESEDGEWTRFHVDLPVAEEA